MKKPKPTEADAAKLTASELEAVLTKLETPEELNEFSAMLDEMRNEESSEAYRDDMARRHRDLLARRQAMQIRASQAITQSQGIIDRIGRWDPPQAWDD